MRRLSRQAVWASSLALIILISYVGVTQAQVLDSVRNRINTTREERVQEVREVREEVQERVEDRVDDRRENWQDKAEEVRGEIEERRTDIQQRIAEKKDEVQGMRSENREHLAQVHAERLEYRFSVYGDRLTSIISRLDARLTAMEDAGQDGSMYRADLAEAEELLLEAENNSADAITSFLDIDPDSYEEQRDQAMQARNIAQTARDQYQGVVAMLQDLVASLKLETGGEE